MSLKKNLIALIIICLFPNAAFCFDVYGLQTGMSLNKARLKLINEYHYTEGKMGDEGDSYFYSQKEGSSYKAMVQIGGCNDKLSYVSVDYHPATLQTMSDVVRQLNETYGDSDPIQATERRGQDMKIYNTSLIWKDGTETVTLLINMVNTQTTTILCKLHIPQQSVKFNKVSFVK